MAVYNSSFTGSEIDARLTAVGSEFVASTAYPIGSLTLRNGVLYQKTSGNTTESWNASHWTQVSLTDVGGVDKTLAVSNKAADAKVTGDDIDELKSALDATTNAEFAEFVPGYIQIPSIGASIDLTRRTSSYNVKSAIIDCTEGDFINITGTTANTVRIWAFADSNNTCLSFASLSINEANNLLVVAPNNAAKVIVQMITGTAYNGKSLEQIAAIKLLSIPLKTIASSGVANSLSANEYGFNTTSKTIYYKDSFDNVFNYAPVNGTVFFFDNYKYVWNGTNIVLDTAENDNTYTRTVMLLSVLATSGVGSALTDGQYGLNKHEGKIYHKIGTRTVSFAIANGSYFIYNDILYKWNNGALDFVLNLNMFESTIYKSADITQGGYYNLGSAVSMYFDNERRFITSNQFNCIYLPVKAGWKIRCSAYGGSGNARAYALVDVSNIIYYIAPGNTTLENNIIDITKDGFIVINSSKDTEIQVNNFYVEILSPVVKMAENSAFINAQTRKNTLLPEYNAENPGNSLGNNINLMGAIHSWGIIGASYDSGELNYYYNSSYSTQSRIDYYAYSWGKILQRMYGIIDLYNFSNGGQNARDWIKSQSGSVMGYQFTGNTEEIVEYFSGTQIPRYSGVGHGGGCWWLAKNNPKQAYAIVLGSNDLNWNHPHDTDWNELSNYDENLYYTAGSVDDIGTYDLTTDSDTPPTGKQSGTAIPGIVNSYAAYIGAIIERILAIQPKAKIFVCTIRNHFSANANQFAIWNEYNDVLKDIVADARFSANCYLVDYGAYGPCYLKREWSDRIRAGGHPDAIGYQIAAYYYGLLINKAIQENLEDFIASAWIGTDHTIYN